MQRKVYVEGVSSVLKRRVLRSIKRGKPILPVYLIFLSAEKDEQLDIISFFMYIVHAKRYKDSKLIGIAASKAHAFELVRKLADKVYKSEHNLDFKSYFNKK